MATDAAPTSGRKRVKRSRSRSPRRESGAVARERSPLRKPSGRRSEAHTTPTPSSAVADGDKDAVELTAEEKKIAAQTRELQAAFGFSAFGSTKNKQVPGNDRNWGVHIAKQTKYRQYMNRQGGFNRQLSPPPEDPKAKKTKSKVSEAPGAVPKGAYANGNTVLAGPHGLPSWCLKKRGMEFEDKSKEAATGDEPRQKRQKTTHPDPEEESEQAASTNDEPHKRQDDTSKDNE